MVASHSFTIKAIESLYEVRSRDDELFQEDENRSARRTKILSIAKHLADDEHTAKAGMTKSVKISPMQSL